MIDVRVAETAHDQGIRTVQASFGYIIPNKQQRVHHAFRTYSVQVESGQKLFFIKSERIFHLSRIQTCHWEAFGMSSLDLQPSPSNILANDILLASYIEE
jgi:hypothetical protein